MSWLLVRGAAANPAAMKFVHLMNKQNISENEVFKPERREPQIISANTDDMITLQDPFDFRKARFVNNWHYYGPFEPDGQFLTYWCRFNHLANRIRDHSFFGNNTIPVGTPRLCGGPDDGTSGGTIVSKLNSGNILDYFYVPDAPRIRVSELVTGFSLYLEFYLDQIVMDNGIEPTIGMKVDDTAGNNGFMVRVGMDGKLKFFVRKAGSTYDFISSANKITYGRYIAATLTYNPVGNIQTMRINNETQIDSGTEAVTFPTNHSLNLFWGVGPSQVSGKLIGRLAQARWYNQMIFTGEHQDNIWNNKRSISPIKYGKLSVAGVSRFNINTYVAGYDDVGFDSVGYDTGSSGAFAGFSSTGYDQAGYDAS